jgi:hypothetical protein
MWNDPFPNDKLMENEEFAEAGNKILLLTFYRFNLKGYQQILFKSNRMSESKLVDGKTGELIGGNYYSTTGGNYVATTTSNYVPATTSYAYGTGSGIGGANQTVTYTTQGGSAQNIYATGYQPGYGVSGGNYAVGGAVGAGSSTQVVGGQVVGTTVNTGKEVIKGESRIEYVPFEKKIVEYKDQAKVERVPKKVKKIEYKEERKIETIPKEVTVTDYYAVEYLRQYIPQYVPEKRIEYIQVPKKQIRYEYIPVERYYPSYIDKLSTIPINPSNRKEDQDLKLDMPSNRDLKLDMLPNREPPTPPEVQPNTLVDKHLNTLVDKLLNTLQVNLDM